MHSNTSTLFYFSRSERIGIAILIFLLIGQWAVRVLWYPPKSSSPYWRKLQLVSMDDTMHQQIIEAYLYDSTWGVDNQFKQRIEINHADSIQLEGLPMIGGYLAQRIVRYREALGGYYSLTQLLEIPQFKESTWEMLYPQLSCNQEVKKINLNSARLEELIQHPYINFTQAQRIIRYRENHGRYTNWESVRQSQSIPDTTWNKLVYYLALDSNSYEPQ